MTARDDIVTYCNELLESHVYKDYCPNGLQVEGNTSVKTIVTGVSACIDLFEEAAALNADMVLVHHGFFWKNENPCILGTKKSRLQSLLQNNISLVAYHLPLDGHRRIGNNAMIGKLMNWKITDHLNSHCGFPIGSIGKVGKPASAASIQKQLTEKFHQPALMITNDPKRTIKSIAWCSGAAADDLEFAIMAGVDAFMTGEPVERIYHQARESNIVFYACGHYATERLGIQALGEHLAKTFNLKHHFIDIPCPI